MDAQLQQTARPQISPGSGLAGYGPVVVLERGQSLLLHGARAQAQRMRFASRLPLIALGLSEMAAAAANYPTFFVRFGQEVRGPFALVGLQVGQNLFVRGEAWEQGHYVPAYVLRYPLATGELGPQDGGEFAVLAEQESLCDPSAEGAEVLVPELRSDGRDESGQDGAASTGQEPGPDSDRWQALQRMLLGFEIDVRAATRLTQELAQAGLLEDVVLRCDPKPGSTAPPQSVDGLLVVSEAAYRALPDETVLRLFRAGQLGAIENHLASLRHVGSLAERFFASALTLQDEPGPASPTSASSRPGKKRNRGH